jgi:hypothetical protein
MTRTFPSIANVDILKKLRCARHADRRYKKRIQNLQVRNVLKWGHLNSET